MQSPEVCTLVIYKSDDDTDKILGRALLWKLRDGKRFMDRIYTANDSDVQLFKDYAKENGWYTKRGNAEQIHCVQYGEPRDTEFSFVPNITDQPPDDIQLQNQTKIKWKGDLYSDDMGRRYIRRQMDANTANMYDVESYYQALNGEIAAPRLMAIEEKKGDDYIIRRVK